MGKINWGRVFLGGLLWGLMTHVLGAANWFLVGEEWIAAMRALGRPFPTPEYIAIFVALIFVLGIAAVWLYAAIRPRYGPGPKTAAIAGVAMSFILTMADVFWASLGLFPISLIAKGVAVYWVIIIVATLAGAWSYKE